MAWLLKNKIVLLWSSTFAGLLLFFSYAVERQNEWSVLFVFSALFALYGLLFIDSFRRIITTIKLQHLVILALAIRLIPLFSMPNLSDDYFRFIWDGNISIEGHNPYQFTPRNFLEQHPDGYLKQALYNGTSSTFPNGMNSKDYYSVYPPFNQLIFASSSFLAGKNLFLNILYLRIVLYLFETATLFIIIHLLKTFNHSTYKVLYYAFNPLVIIEIIQNLHFEGTTLFFLFLSVYFLSKRKILYAAMGYALAVTTKLIPLMFLPLFFKRITFRQLLLFYTTTVLIVVLLFLPFSDVNLLHTFGSSVRLYFKSFEFNASIYYLLRSIGFWYKGYNIIASIGSITPFITLGIISYFSLKPPANNFSLQTLFTPVLIVITSYYALASIVHPWYIIYLVGIGLFTPFKYPFVWSFSVIFSYIAYKDAGIVSENTFFIIAEYTLVALAMYYDFRRNTSKTITFL